MHRTILALGLLLATGGQAMAQGGEGRVNAAVYAPIPDGAVVFVRPRTDNDDNLEIKGMMERELMARGYGVAADAPLVVTFWTSGSYDLTKPRNTGTDWIQERRDGGIFRHSDVEGRGQGNLFNSKGGGLFQNPVKRKTSTLLGSIRHRLDVAVKDRQTGKRVWQGQAYADISGGDPLTITEALLRPLMDSFGKTVRRNKFQVQ